MTLERRDIDVLRRFHGIQGVSRGEKVSRAKAVEVTAALLQDDVPQVDIAKVLGVTPRSVRSYVTEARGVNEMRSSIILSDAEKAEMMAWSTDAFVKWFEWANGQGLKVPDHVKQWLDAYFDTRYVMINTPPAHAKSTYFSRWLPTWLICRDPNVRIILVSRSQHLADEHTQAIAWSLTFNEKLVRNWGPFVPESRAEGSVWRTTGGQLQVRGRERDESWLTVLSRGSRQQILGQRADHVIVDDVTDAAVATSPTERDRELRWLRTEVLTRAKGGRCIVIGSRVHPLDLYGELENQKIELGEGAGATFWTTLNFPHVLDWEKHEVLWPAEFDSDGNQVSGWTWEETMNEYERIGGLVNFSTIHQGQPLPDGGGIVRPGWLERCYDYDRPAGTPGHRDKGETWVRVLSVDPSPTQWNAVVVADVLKPVNSEVFRAEILAIYRVKADINDLLKLMHAAITQYDIDLLIFETSAITKFIEDLAEFQRLRTRCRVLKHTTGANKNRDAFGVQSLAGSLEFGELRFPMGDETGQTMTALFTDEAIVWPAGRTDDVIMAIWFLKFNARKLPTPMRELPTRSNGGTYSYIKRAREQQFRPRTREQEKANMARIKAKEERERQAQREIEKYYRQYREDHGLDTENAEDDPLVGVQ